MHKGIQSTEFYITVGFMLFFILAKKFGIEISSEERMTLMAVISAYIGSRTIIKLRNGNGNGSNDVNTPIKG